MLLWGLTQSQWREIGISLAIVLAAIIFGRLLVSGLVIPVLKRILQRTATSLDDHLIDATGGPIYWLLVLATLGFALARLEFLQDFQIHFILDDSIFVLYLLVFYVLAWRVTSTLATWYTAQFAQQTDAKLGSQLMPFFSRVALILITIIAAIILLDHFNVEVSGLVATLGIGSLAIALAAQAALSDTISGFIIMIDRPYRIGDRIEILELDTWGDVMDIGLRSTRIRTRDNRMAIVPNSVIGKSLVVNHSYPDNNYRLQIELGVAYGSDIEQVRQVLIDAVKSVEGVLQDQPVEALFLEFGDSALIFRVRWWLDDYYDTRRMFDKVNTAIYNALNAAEIEIPFPQRVMRHKLDEADRALLKKTSK